MLRNVPTLYNRIYDWEPFVCNSIWLFIGTGECDGNSVVIKIIGTRDRAPASHFCYPPDNKRFHPSTRIRPPLVPPFFRKTFSRKCLSISRAITIAHRGILKSWKSWKRILFRFINIFVEIFESFEWKIDSSSREIWESISKDIIERYSLRLDGSNFGYWFD